MLKEFKEFAVRGNVLDLAVAVIVGAAFGGVVTSFVNDVLMPPIGLLVGRMDFSNLFITLSSGAAFGTLADAKKAGVATLNYGLFLNTLINFLIVSFAVFILVKQVNRLKRPVPAPPAPAVRECPYCLSSVPAAAVRCAHCTSDIRVGGKAGA